MKYYLIAGEASGDLHGSNLIKELKKRDQKAVFRSWGGDLMEKAGSTVVKHYKDLSFMGFIEVVKNLPTILTNLKFCKGDITSFQPDVLILIDYPGFNLRIAQWAKQQGYKIIYYISPQVWAWKEGRVKLIKKVVDKMLVILPFEKEFYRKWNYDVAYIGHPLVQVINEYKNSGHALIPILENPTKPIIALLPGSRKQEVSIKLPIMLQAATAFPQYQFIVAKAPSLDEAFYSEILKDYPQVGSVLNETYALLSKSVGALVTSGTATLETALFGVPEIVCYKGSAISYQIARRLIKIKYISLVNLIMDKLVVTELIQNDLTSENIIKELTFLLSDPLRKERVQKDYAALRELLQQGGDASAKAADMILTFLQPTSSK
ncbi:MAG: lipid-A-disaccharide synthase [Chitinophagaceae bacterium]